MAQKSGKQLHEVAMGQGQAEVAIEKLKQSAKSGSWLCLKNLHLMTFWIPILEKELHRYESISRNFRYRNNKVVDLFC